MFMRVLARIRAECMEEKAAEAEVSNERGNPDRDLMLCALALSLNGIHRNTFQTWLSMGPILKRTP